MHYTHQLEHAFARTGITLADLDATVASLAPALEDLQHRRNPCASAILSLAHATDDLGEIETTARYFSEQFDHLVVIGAGGSGLSGKMLMMLRHHNFGTHQKPALHFLENIDPFTIQSLLDALDLRRTGFFVISKSGNTLETLTQAVVLLEAAEKHCGKASVARQFVFMSVPGDNPLRALGAHYGVRVIDHTPDLCGRFSILSAVGLIPARVAGLDVAALRQGAASLVDALDKTGDPSALEPARGAALQYLLMQKGYDISVMLPYCDRLAGLGMWYRQSWAESLGKQGKGSTPIYSRGATDQHSQLQLYLDGPRDKFFSLVLLDMAGTGQPIRPPIDGSEVLRSIRNHTTGDIMAAEQKATAETLVHNGCPTRIFGIAHLDETVMGALLMHLTLEIIFTAHLLNVNPFDQPAVEEGKKLAHQYLLADTL